MNTISATLTNIDLKHDNNMMTNETHNNDTDIDSQDNKSPINIIVRNNIEIYEINSDIMGSHAVHWDALTQNPTEDVPRWISEMIDFAVIPAGIAPNDAQHDMLLIASDADVHVSQVFQLDEEHRPNELITAFPTVNSVYTLDAKIERIIENTDTNEAVLRLGVSDGTTIYAYDALYVINKPFYTADTAYTVELSGICHTLERSSDDEVIMVTDKDAIRHHRALNDILSKNDGNAPDDLQQQLTEWTATKEEDTLPVSISLGKMCAYLFGDNLGQEDEAWCQGEIIGMQEINALDTALYLLDVVVLREENTQPVVVRTVCTVENAPDNIQVGEFISTNMWLQAKICGIKQKVI